MAKVLTPQKKCLNRGGKIQGRKSSRGFDKRKFAFRIGRKTESTSFRGIKRALSISIERYEKNKLLIESEIHNQINTMAKSAIEYSGKKNIPFDLGSL